MTQIFREILHKTVECYVDDLAVKSRKRVDHLADLRKVFLRLRQHNLKMNPIKCFFGVLSGKFLGFIVRKKGIKVYPAKTKDILGMPSPTNIKELRGFLFSCYQIFKRLGPSIKGTLCGRSAICSEGRIRTRLVLRKTMQDQ